MSQQNGNSQMQNLVGGGGDAPSGTGLGPSRVSPADHNLLTLRQGMRIKIFNILQQKQPSPADEASKAKYMDVARRLEEGLFKIANSKEDYLNQSTLEPRLTSLIKGRQLTNYNQRHANSSSVGTMVPTPGLQHSGGNLNMMMTSSVDSTMAGSNNITTTAMNTGNLLNSGGMLGGNISNGYQHSSSNLVGGGGDAPSGTGVGPSRVSPVDHDILTLRQGMRTKIFNILQQKQPSPADEASTAKYMNVARRLEEGLFKIANTKEDYLNQSTLEPRLASIIKDKQLNNYSSQILPATSQSDICTSVPQNSQQIQQMLHQQSMASDSVNSFSKLSLLD